MARPPFKPTAALRSKVAIAAGGGMSHEEIAIGLGISRTTLNKHFARELSTGAYAKRLEIMQAMHRTAKKGNVAAQKAYVALSPRAATVPAPKEAPLGKKEQAQADAVGAQEGTDWDELIGPNVVRIR